MTDNVIHLFANHDVEEILNTLETKHAEKGIRSISVVYTLNAIKEQPQECISETHISVAEDTTLMLGAVTYNQDQILNELKKYVV